MRSALLLVIIIFLTTTITASAQEVNKKISGVITDVQNLPVSAATVVLLLAADSSTVKGAATDEQGKFGFSKIKNGVYVLMVTGVGYKKYRSIPLTLDEGHASIRLPAIILQRTNTGALQEVAVTAKKALVEEQIDRTVVNVDAMIGNAGSNALDVLSKSPGVTVTSDGSISLNGNGAVYDASGGSVINIRLRKNRAAGFTGNISAGYSQGTYGRSNDALNLNYRDKKVTLFANLGYGLYKNYTQESSQRYFTMTTDR